MKKINWGIIGLGNIAQTFSEAFNDANNSKLLAVSSNNSIKLEKFKNRFNINQKYIFSSYEDLLNCEDVDIIYITLPNSLHYDWIITNAVEYFLSSEIERNKLYPLILN